ncbi:MAG: hypothetical protein CMI96_01110 [Pelagibacteraceae bacterium]|nr:hypothetical protein [Pelagibacteraceae bacterium]|tara:strand:+ start:16439 stop:16843 length:405 start_codon:yes stop_codon:yes gene_type:complete
MNKLWDDLKDNMKEWGASAVEKAEEISRVAVAKGEEFTKISKIKIEIMQLEKEITKNHEKLGKLVHRYAQDDNMVNFTGNTEFFEIIKQIDDKKIQVDLKNKNIEEIKKVYGIEDDDIDYQKNYPSNSGKTEEE